MYANMLNILSFKNVLSPSNELDCVLLYTNNTRQNLRMDSIHDAKTNYYVNSEEEELTFDSRKEEINHGQSGI